MHLVLQNFLQPRMVRVNPAIFFRQERRQPAHDLVGGFAHRLLTSSTSWNFYMKWFTCRRGDMRAAEMFEVFEYATVLGTGQRHRDDRVSALAREKCHAHLSLL